MKDNEKQEKQNDNYIMKLRLKTRFQDADPQGVVHNSIYLIYYDEVRIELIDKCIPMYNEDIAMMMISETHNKYILPVKYSENIEICLKLIKQTPVRSVFVIEIFNEKGEMVNKAKQVIAWVSKEGKIVNIKKVMPDMYELLRGMVSDEEE